MCFGQHLVSKLKKYIFPLKQIVTSIAHRILFRCVYFTLCNNIKLYMKLFWNVHKTSIGKVNASALYSTERTAILFFFRFHSQRYKDYTMKPWTKLQLRSSQRKSIKSFKPTKGLTKILSKCRIQTTSHCKNSSSHQRWTIHCGETWLDMNSSQSRDLEKRSLMLLLTGAKKKGTIFF